jgi:hypothetical protein
MQLQHSSRRTAAAFDTFMTPHASCDISRMLWPLSDHTGLMSLFVMFRQHHRQHHRQHVNCRLSLLNFKQGIEHCAISDLQSTDA